MNRSAMRELAFKLLYSIEIQKEDSDSLIELFMESNEIEDEKAIAYMKDMVAGIRENKESILSYITESLKEDWELSRISKLNLALLKLGIYEILYKNIPFKVVINEVVELAKKYGEETSSSFVNGILATVIKKSQKEESN